MQGFEHATHFPGAAEAGGATGIAPGKRSLTQSLMPVQRSLRDEQRAVVDFDDAAGDDIYDERATVDATASSSPLTDRQLRRAQRKNPGWVRSLKVSAQVFSTADVASSAFALDVAEKQAAHGLLVDGIAGPKTVAALVSHVAGTRSASERGGSANDTSPFAAEDPFAVHLIGA